jgi:polyisoprenyl-phosphate glycosyltransferase
MDCPFVSIVVPVFNEEECISELVHHIGQTFLNEPYGYEIIFIDDASRDQTPLILERLSKQDPRIKGVRLSRNSGHQAALACGLATAKGDVVITMDGDLQHPPALIPQMLRLWRDENYDIVNTLRRKTIGSGYIDRIGSRLFYKVFNRVADIQLVPGAADFRLLDRRAVDALNSMQEYFKFFRGQVPYIGFKQTTIQFDCPPRFAGSRSYTLRQSLRLASNGLMSFSTFGLKLPLMLGVFILFMVLLYGGLSTALILTGRTHLIEGWLSLAVLMCLNLGVQLTFLGMIGLYVGKIFIEVKGRPLYFVDQTFGFEQAAKHRTPAVTPWRQLQNTADVRASN